MDDNSEFSEEGLVFSGIIQELMLTNSACRMLVDSRCEALQEVVSSTCQLQPPGAIRPTAASLRASVDTRAAEILNRKLAACAEDSHTLVSAMAQMLAAFLPPKNEE